MKSKGIIETIYETYFWPRLTKSEKQERQQTEKKKESFKISTITEVKSHNIMALTEVTLKLVMYYLFTFELFLETPILLWHAGSFFSLKTMDGWQSVFYYHGLRRGPLKLWHHGFQIQGLRTLVKDLLQHFQKCWCQNPIGISSDKGFRTQKNINRRAGAGTNNKLKFVSLILQTSAHSVWPQA